MTRKIKIIHYIPGFDVGGIESRLLDWYRNIDRNKVEFIVIKMNNKLSEKAREFIELGGRFCNIPSLNSKSIFQYIKALDKVLKEEKPDIVHVHCMNSGLFCLYLAKKNNIKTRIFHSRTTDFLPNEKNLFIKKIIKKLTPKFATDYFACSYEAGVWGNGKKNSSKTIVINNGIELPLFKYDDNNRMRIRKELHIDDKLVIGTIGRLSPQKNLFFLLELFNQVMKKDDNNKYHLVIVGSGPLESEIIEKLNELNISDKVTLIPSKINVWDYYMAFDIFISTSYYEGFGTTAIEAQATGVPTILSTGFPEKVVISDYVKRIDLQDPIDEWFNAIINTKKRKRSNSDCINVDKNGYSAKAVAKQLEEFYCNHKNNDLKQKLKRGIL